MTDKVQKIREEVEMVVNRRLNLLNGDYFDLNEETNGFTNEIMDIIDYLQKEPVSKEIGDYDHKAVMEALHPELKEESVSEDLEKISYYFACMCHPLITAYSTSSPNPEVIEAFKAGAKWQIAKLMKNAIDGEVLENYDGKVLEYDDLILDEKLSNCKVFDKVKIIVIKED